MYIIWRLELKEQQKEVLKEKQDVKIEILDINDVVRVEILKEDEAVCHLVENKMNKKNNYKYMVDEANPLYKSNYIYFISEMILSNVYFIILLVEKEIILFEK